MCPHCTPITFVLVYNKLSYIQIENVLSLVPPHKAEGTTSRHTESEHTERRDTCPLQHLLGAREGHYFACLPPINRLQHACHGNSCFNTPRILPSERPHASGRGICCGKRTRLAAGAAGAAG